jgi:hypothetical protein
MNVLEFRRELTERIAVLSLDVDYRILLSATAAPLLPLPQKPANLCELVITDDNIINVSRFKMKWSSGTELSGERRMR